MNAPRIRAIVICCLLALAAAAQPGPVQAERHGADRERRSAPAAHRGEVRDRHLAQAGGQDDGDRRQAPARRGISLDQAIKMVESRYKARVVRAEARKGDGRTIYVLRLLNESGRVWTVRVDAESGQIL